MRSILSVITVVLIVAGVLSNSSPLNSVDAFTLNSSTGEYPFLPGGRKLLSLNLIRHGEEKNCSPLAINNFPDDAFTNNQRRHGAVLLHIFAVIYTFIGLAIICEDYFVPCLECICKYVAGATFMAAGSSAPELATTIAGVFIAKDDIALGAVVGSADFNVMLVISVTALCAKQVIYLDWWPLMRDSAFYLISILLLTATIADGKVYWYEGLIFLLVYALYVLLMYFNSRLATRIHVWCEQRLPSLVRSQSEQQGFDQQSTGAFGRPALTDGGDGQEGPAPPQTGYVKFDDEEEKDADINYTDPFPGNNNVQDASDNMFDAGAGDNSLNDPTSVVIKTSSDSQPETESWTKTCFASLRLPAKDNFRAKLYYSYCLLVWPLRLVFSLTTPDMRQPRWQRYRFVHWITFINSCIWIGLLTTMMMWMITVIGFTLSIPDTIMGLTFIAAGSSVPDAIASVIVVREGEGDMAVSNAIGSNIFDILVCMGLPWLLKSIVSRGPVLIYSRGLLYATLTLFTTVVFLVIVTHINRWRLTKKYGLILMVGYVVVLAFCSCYELNVFGKVHEPPCPYVERT